MGMFDSVFVKCRNKDCDKVIEFQSKAGPCQLKKYDLDEIPLSVAEDLDNARMTCPKCQYETTIRIPGSVPKFIAMKVV
jgi:hypothetical protein